MDFQLLCEIAERELNAGLADPRLIDRARAEANGIDAHARQIFWRLRAKQLQAVSQGAGGDAAIREVIADIEAQEARIHARKESNRWFWAVAFVTGALGALSFPILALQAAGKSGRSFWTFAVLALASLSLAVIARRASSYHTYVE